MSLTSTQLSQSKQQKNSNLSINNGYKFSLRLMKESTLMMICSFVTMQRLFRWKGSKKISFKLTECVKILDGHTTNKRYPSDVYTTANCKERWCSSSVSFSGLLALFLVQSMLVLTCEEFVAHVYNQKKWKLCTHTHK